jgi:gamma-glutamylcyclotransferase
MILFSYGSNTNPGIMAERCPGAETVGAARLMDYRLCFPRYSRVHNGALVGIEPSPGHAVWGVLFSIPPSEVDILNYHEGYDARAPLARNVRVLRAITVHRVGSYDPVNAQAYFTIPDGTAERPSREYLQQIIDGATYHGLPKTWIAALERLAAG